MYNLNDREAFPAFGTSYHDFAAAKIVSKRYQRLEAFVSMSDRYAIIITSINYPTRAVVEIARDAGQLGAEFVIVGDRKSPPDFVQPGATYLDLKAQARTGFRYAVEARSSITRAKTLAIFTPSRRAQPF